MKIRNVAAAAALTIVAGVAQASLVSNGGFESGLTGWSCLTFGGGCFTGTQSGIPPVEGLSYFFGFSNDATGHVSQDLATEIGATYSVSLSFNTNGGVPPNALSIQVGDLSAALGLQLSTWNSYMSTFTASSTTTTLDFLFNTVGGSGTVFIDQVAVERVGTVPLPPTAMLVALGLLALAVTRRRS